MKPEINMQLRHITTKATQLRANPSADGKTVIITGYAAVFDSESEVIDGSYRETIAPGAFSDVLENDCRFLVNHLDLPLARTASGTLSLKQDNIGLYCEARCDATDPDVMRLIPKMTRGDVDQMSFAFDAKYEDTTWMPQPAEDGYWRCRINKVSRLFDVSVVTIPAYTQTQCEVSMRGNSGRGMVVSPGVDYAKSLAVRFLLRSKL